MRWTGLILAAALAFGGCRFAPTVDGEAINDCKSDADCPVCGTCTKGVCVPLPPALDELTVEVAPAVVAAGESCTFTVVGATCGTSFRWRQVTGPRLAQTVAEGESWQIATLANEVAGYTVEVTVTNATSSQSARASCTALVEGPDSAWVVAGATGDCSKADPCGSYADIAVEMSSAPSRVYLGVRAEDAGEMPTVFELATVGSDGSAYFSSEFNDLEVHGGFIAPEWARDVERARTALSGDGGLGFDCWRCLLTGLYQRRVISTQTGVVTPEGLVLHGRNVELRESVLAVQGELSGDFTIVTGLIVIGMNNRLQDVRVTVTGAYEDTLRGVGFGGLGGQVVERLSVDLTGAVATGKTGLRVENDVHLDRVTVQTGNTTDWSQAIEVRCAAPTIWNSVFDARGLGAGSAFGASVHQDNDASCALAPSFHSVTLLGGSGATSTGLWILLPTGMAPSVSNSILDAGRGSDRYAVAVSPDFYAPSDMLSACTLVVNPAGALDSGVAGRREATGSDFAPEAEIAEALGAVPITEVPCPGCLASVVAVPYRDAESRDYHLTAEAACCIGTGALISVDTDPTVDRDGLPRPSPPSRASTGAYEYVPSSAP